LRVRASCQLGAAFWRQTATFENWRRGEGIIAGGHFALPLCGSLGRAHERLAARGAEGGCVRRGTIAWKTEQIDVVWSHYVVPVVARARAARPLRVSRLPCQKYAEKCRGGGGDVN
jgi:hypothetical protein